MSKPNKVFEVIGPNSLIKDGSMIARRIPWRGGRGSIVVVEYTTSDNTPVYPLGPYLANPLIASAGGTSDPALNACIDTGNWPFELPAGDLVFLIAPTGRDLAFGDGGLFVAEG